MKRSATIDRWLAVATWLTLLLFVALPACSKKAPDEGSECDKEGNVICNGKKKAFLCAGGTWQALDCRGVTGCMSMGASAKDSCNNAKSKVGEPCVSDKPVCKFDGKGVMECKDNKWVVVQKCAGLNGCVVSAKGWKCDMSTGDEGDPCMESSKDTYACSTDKKMMLRCDGKKMVPHAKCPGLHGCRKQFKKIECNGEQPI